MRYPRSNPVRPLRDDEVDRADVEVWQHMELTVTNRSKAYPEKREDAGEESSSASAEA